MTASLTRSASFTLTDARYVGAKIGADLRTLRALYGQPADLDKIDKFVEEIALLLNKEYLGTADYGFRDRNAEVWKLRLRYRATIGGQLVDDNPGGVPRSANVAGLTFYSYLTYSSAFNNLPLAEQLAFKQTLPITRTGATETPLGLGASTPGRAYGRNGAGVSRDVFVALDI
jgi:hypothetical protein